jgi:hypothetical protein
MKLKGSIAGVTLSFLCLSSILYAERVQIPEGTRVEVRLQADLLSNKVSEGDAVYFEVSQPVMIGGLVAIPAGAVAWGAVQSVKQDKYVKFDIASVRLPDLAIIKLRSKPEKSKNPAKDLIKVDSELRDTVGAPKGNEFTAYVDQDTLVEASAAALPASAPAANPTPAPVQVAPPAVTTPAPATRPAPAPAAPAVATGELITVDCSSDPEGADILIDGDFYGTTPSLLKLPPGTHQLEFRLESYKTHSESLNLQSGAGLQTIRRPLEKKE